VSYATIAATGRCVPSRVLTNADVGRMVGEDVDAWLVKNVGIRERRVMADDERTSDLATAAAREALTRAGVPPEDVDLVVVATDTPDYISPATAAVVQGALGAHRAGAYDVNAACAGWVTALDCASKTIASDDEVKNVLVIGAYGMSRYVDWSDKRTATLFADGAGAVLLRASRKPGYLGGKLAAFGAMHDALGIYTGGTARPATAATVAQSGSPKVEFVKRFSPSFNVEHWPGLVRGVVERAGLRLDDVGLFLFTQLNLRSIESTMEALGQPLEKAHWTMDKWGYTGSACLPMTLDDAAMHGRLRDGKHVVFCASGGGVCMAASVVRWNGANQQGRVA
jgi:3-oxoacyl-[acyl-carrier-protein] synthase III